MAVSRSFQLAERIVLRIGCFLAYLLPVRRLFVPTALDLDDLAEALRSLLGFTSPPQIGPPSRPNPDLLSLPGRGTHVVEATETP